MTSADVAQNVTEFQSPGWAEAFWRHGFLTPQDGRRGTDASKLVFPLQMVVLIVGMVGSFWVATSAIRSDVRDILTRMSVQTRVDEANQKLQEERIAALKAAIDALQRQQTMQDLKLQNLKDTLLTSGRKTP